MKFSALFALTVAAQDGSAAQQGDGSAAQQAPAAQGYGAPEQQQSYAAPEAESYSAPEQAYSAPSYTAAAAPAYVAAPKCCVSSCPSHAPFFNLASCGCVAGIQYAAPAYEAAHYEQPSYAAPAQSYGGEQQAQSYGGEQQEQSGYRKLMVQPRGTIDTRLNEVTSTGRVALWVAFGILFLSGWVFLSNGISYKNLANANNPVSRRFRSFLSTPLITEGFVCLIASLAYLTMATGNGYYTRCCDGRQFLFARYIDWVLTTPLLLHSMLHFTGATDDDLIYVFFMDVLMIVAGLIASLVCDGWKWFFFAFSMLVFIPVMQTLCAYKSEVVDTRFDYILFYHRYATFANLTVLVWFIYPIVWILSEGTNTLSVDAEVIFYTVLDIIAKAFLGFLILSSKSIYNEDKYDAAAIKAALAALGISTK
jgi:bacteriorhodopsin